MPLVRQCNSWTPLPPPNINTNIFQLKQIFMQEETVENVSARVENNRKCSHLGLFWWQVSNSQHL